MFKTGDKVYMVSGYTNRAQGYVGQIGTIFSVIDSSIHPGEWIIWIEYPDGKKFGPLSHRVRHAHTNNKEAAASLLRRD